MEMCRIDERIKDGDVLPIAGGIEVIHTPGHSKGHISLL
jgi:glyoxylase-like metal-dependent hydrolase (beta-lactamase superfamily II)